MPVLMAVLVLVSACGANLEATSFLRVEATDFSNLVRQATTDSSITLIDLRTPEEVATGYISGAINLDVLGGSFEASIDELDNDDHLLIYARSTAASAEAARLLKDAGFTHITELNGGIEAWVTSGRPLETP
jgi:rhodanese-related sulfurtransferase